MLILSDCPSVSSSVLFTGVLLVCFEVNSVYSLVALKPLFSLMFVGIVVVAGFN